jgi:hypothetical protein
VFTIVVHHIQTTISTTKKNDILYDENYMNTILHVLK